MCFIYIPWDDAARQTQAKPGRHLLPYIAVIASSPLFYHLLTLIWSQRGGDTENSSEPLRPSPDNMLAMAQWRIFFYPIRLFIHHDLNLTFFPSSSNAISCSFHVQLHLRHAACSHLASFPLSLLFQRKLSFLSFHLLLAPLPSRVLNPALQYLFAYIMYFIFFFHRYLISQVSD